CGSPRTTVSIECRRVTFSGERVKAVTACERAKARSRICVPVWPVAPRTKSRMSSAQPRAKAGCAGAAENRAACLRAHASNVMGLCPVSPSTVSLISTMRPFRTAATDSAPPAAICAGTPQAVEVFCGPLYRHIQTADGPIENLRENIHLFRYAPQLAAGQLEGFV